MSLLRTTLKILFPPAGVTAVLGDIDDALARAVGPRPAEEAPSEAAVPSYIECRTQHTTETGIAACEFHNRPENTPQWLRTERFAATRNRRRSTPDSAPGEDVQPPASTRGEPVGNS